MPEIINSKVSAFNFAIKKKGYRSYLQADVFFQILSEINVLPYDRNGGKSRNKHMGDYDLVLDLLDFPKKLNPNGTTINFFIGRETKENFPTRDTRGKFHIRKLREEENLCFKTHGCFVFKKIENIWVCCLLFERRFHTIGLSRLIYYLEKLKTDFTFEASTISTIPKIINKINGISKLKSVIIKNKGVDFEKDDGAGTVYIKDKENKKFNGLNIEIAILEGDTTLEKIKNLFIAFYKGKKEFNEANLREFALESDLVLVGRGAFGGSYKVDLFESLILYKLKVLILESRELDSADFFKKIGETLTEKETEKLLKISRKFYNDVKIENTLENS